MKVSIKQIALFIEIAKQGNVSKAAKALSLTQAAASMALAEFEKHLATKLFDRIGKKLVLNQSGAALLPKAIEIMDKIQELNNFSLRQEMLPSKPRIKIMAVVT